jgi:hypothetical protein
MEHGVHHLLKWDFAVAFASSILVTLWFARSRRQLILLAAWSTFATPAFGPGAATMGVFLWREASLQGDVDINVTKVSDSGTSTIAALDSSNSPITRKYKL